MLMDLNGIDMFCILWVITPFWIGRTEIKIGMFATASNRNALSALSMSVCI